MKLNNSILSKLNESKEMPKKYRELASKIEDLGWEMSVVEYSNGDYLCFQKYSNAGEDFFFEVPMGTELDLLREVREYAENFDPVEHAQEMLGAPGAPDLRTLLSDADDINKDLEELSKILEANIKVGPIEESLKDKLDKDEDYVWSEETSKFKNEEDFRKYLDQYFMKDVDIPFNLFDYKRVIIDSNNKKVEPLTESIRDFRYSEDDIDILRDLLYLEGPQSGGLIRFDRVPLENLKQVVDKRLAWDGDRQNYGRSIREILKLEETLPGADIKVDGYVVMPPRKDQRVSVDSVTIDLTDCKVDSAEEIVKEFAENADEFDENGNEYYMWWD